MLRSRLGWLAAASGLAVLALQPVASAGVDSPCTVTYSVATWDVLGLPVPLFVHAHAACEKAPLCERQPWLARYRLCTVPSPWDPNGR